MADGERKSERPLLTASASRLAAAVLLIGCAAVTAVAGLACARDTNGDVLDGPIDSWALQHLGSHVHAMQLAADLGQRDAITVMTALLIAGSLAARRVNGALLALVSVPVAAALTELVLKPLVNQRYSSYPSGRTTAIFAVIAVVGVLLTSPPRARIRPAARTIVVIAGVLVGCAVALATIALGYHRFTDVAGGATVGTGVVLATAFVLDLPPCRRLLAAFHFGWHRREEQVQD